jgi:hypothetical protein
MGDIGNVLSVVGVEVDSTIGKITRLISSFESLLGSVKNVTGLLSGGGGGGLGLGGLLGGLFGGGAGGSIPTTAPLQGSLLEGLGMEAAGASAGTGFLGGFGSVVGGGLAKFGSTLAPLFTNPFTAIVGGGLVAFFALTDVFKKANIAETVSRDFGTEISKGLQESLGSLAEEVGDLSTAAALGLSDIFGEAIASGTANFDLFAERIADTFSFLERGQITATEAQQILNESVAQLLPHLDELGPAGEAQIQRLINAAEEFGITFEGLGQLGGPISSSIEEIAEKFGITTDAARELAEFLDVKVKTNVQRIADELEIPPKLLKEIGTAVKEQFGIPLEGIQALLMTMGISIDDLATAFGIKIPENIDKATSSAEKLGDEIKKIPRTVNVAINERRNGSVEIPGLKHGGLVPAMPPFGSLYRLGEREPELVIPQSKLGQAQPAIIELHVIKETAAGTVESRQVHKIVNDGISTGRIRI